MIYPRHARVFAAIDLGASSGRVITGVLDGDALDLHEVRRFETSRVEAGPLLRWDVERIFAETLAGLAQVQRDCASSQARLCGIGVDSWGVDHALLLGGRLALEDVRHHRRAGVPADGYDDFRSTVAERYATTGVLDQAINTVQQLAVRRRADALPAGAVPLFIPDVWIHLLTGAVGTDPTIASTSQLLDVSSGDWSAPLLADLGMVPDQMPPVQPVGSVAGETLPTVTARLGLTEPVPVFRVGGHDTASAFAFARPARTGGRTLGLVSGGTWSLAGICLTAPVTGQSAREAGFTTERGVRGSLMVRNLSGMWVLQEALRVWRQVDPGVDLLQVLREAAATPGAAAVFDPADRRLLDPPDMTRTICELADEAGRPRPHR